MEERRWIVWAVVGPLAVGASLGLRFGVQSAATLGLALPAILAGVTALTAPALYIGAAFTGVAPPPREVLVALGEGLADAGTVLLGLTPTLLLLTATATQTLTVAIVGYAVVLLGVGLALRQLYRRLFEDTRGPWAPVLYIAWSVVGLGIGAHLLAQVLTAQGGVS